MDWTLLRTVADWDAYRLKTVTDYGIHSGVTVPWGSGPQMYPCLVATRRPHR